MNWRRVIKLLSEVFSAPTIAAAGLAFIIFFLFFGVGILGGIRFAEDFVEASFIKSLLLGLTTAVGTFIMAIAVLEQSKGVKKQVKKDQELLNLYRPSIETIKKDDTAFSQEKYESKNATIASFGILNTSRTSIAISEALLPAVDRKAFIHGNKLDNINNKQGSSRDADFTELVPIGNNEAVLFSVKIKNLSEEEEEELFSQDSITVLLKGTFGKETVDIPVEG